MKAEVAVLVSPSLIALMVSVDVKRTSPKPEFRVEWSNSKQHSETLCFTMYSVNINQTVLLKITTAPCGSFVVLEW